MKLSAIHPCLIRPEGAGNVGSAVRAAKVMGLGSVMLVKPHVALGREARMMAAGAVGDLEQVRSFDTLDEALKKASRVFGFSARRREHRTKPVWLEEAVEGMLAASDHGPVVMLFGNERTGLENEELDRAHVLVRIPTSARFKSINLAQSVMVAAYALRRNVGAEMEEYPYSPANADDVERCIAALIAALDRRDFFISSKRDLAIRRIRDLLGRAVVTENEILLLRGMIRSLDGEA